MTSPTKRFWNLLKQYNSILKQIYLYALFIGIVNLTLPVGIQAIINYLQTGEYTSTWIILVGFVLLGMTLMGILQVLQFRLVENIQQDLFTRSAFEFAYRLPQITYLRIDKLHAPELVNRFFDTLTIQKGLPKILIDFSLAIFQIVFGLILLTIYSSYFIILGFALAFLLWIIFKITGPKGLETSLKESKYKYSLAHWLEEIARTNFSFKIFSKEKLHLNKTDDTVSDYLKSREKHFKILLNQYWMFIGFKLVMAAGLLVLGSFLVFEEKINLGQFVAAEIIIILIINSTEKVLKLIETIYDVLTGLEKIGYVTDMQLDKNDGTAIVRKDHGISIKAKNVYFGFPDDGGCVINNLSFTIESNEKVVLKGRSGSGKSMLMRVLAGIHPIKEGDLYINDIPQVNYDKDSYYESVGVTFPTNQIFEGTIKENILVGREFIEDDVLEVIKLLKLDDFLNNQPQGINTIIDSGGRRLPRSIVQKLEIARVLINKPKLLLLEDPFLFLDEEEKIKIIDYLMDPGYLSTIIIISDFYYWKEKCDRIIDLNLI